MVETGGGGHCLFTSAIVSIKKAAFFFEDAFYDCFAAFFKTALDNVVSARVKHQAQCAWRCAEK